MGVDFRKVFAKKCIISKNLCFWGPGSPRSIFVIFGHFGPPHGNQFLSTFGEIYKGVILRRFLSFFDLPF
jgi:hypothetical protein